MLGNSQAAEQLAASQEGVRSMESNFSLWINTSFLNIQLTFAIILSMEIMVKSASCGTSESCVSISPYSISLAAEIFDCKCCSSKQVHSLAV
jgi:hypothetical protein